MSHICWQLLLVAVLVRLECIVKISTFNFMHMLAFWSMCARIRQYVLSCMLGAYSTVGIKAALWVRQES
jgi:hypothetical protein